MEQCHRQSWIWPFAFLCCGTTHFKVDCRLENVRVGPRHPLEALLKSDGNEPGEMKVQTPTEDHVREEREKRAREELLKWN